MAQQWGLLRAPCCRELPCLVEGGATSTSRAKQLVNVTTMQKTCPCIVTMDGNASRNSRSILLIIGQGVAEWLLHSSPLAFNTSQRFWHRFYNLRGRPLSLGRWRTQMEFLPGWHADSPPCWEGGWHGVDRGLGRSTAGKGLEGSLHLPNSLHGWPQIYIKKKIYSQSFNNERVKSAKPHTVENPHVSFNSCPKLPTHSLVLTRSLRIQSISPYCVCYMCNVLYSYNKAREEKMLRKS